MLADYGELAALFGAFFLSLASTFNTFAGRKLGSALLIRTSLPLALLCTLGIHWVKLGTPLPHAGDLARWLWLATSGVIGLGVSFVSVVEAFVLIGPRLSTLITTLAPVFSALLAWLFLDETLTVLAIAGMALTLGGVLCVVLDRQRYATVRVSGTLARGLFFALVAALSQALSLVLSKKGLAGDFPPLSGAIIRLLGGMVALWLVAFLRHDIRAGIRKVRAHPEAIKYIVGGTLTGPVLGIWLGLIAVQRAPVGIANTLLNMTPIFLLPVGYFVFHENITPQAIVGTVIAVCGTALLVL